MCLVGISQYLRAQIYSSWFNVHCYIHVKALLIAFQQTLPCQQCGWSPMWYTTRYNYRWTLVLPKNYDRLYVLRAYLYKPTLFDDSNQPRVRTLFQKKYQVLENSVHHPNKFGGKRDRWKNVVYVYFLIKLQQVWNLNAFPQRYYIITHTCSSGIFTTGECKHKFEFCTAPLLFHRCIRSNWNAINLYCIALKRFIPICQRFHHMKWKLWLDSELNNVHSLCPHQRSWQLFKDKTASNFSPPLTRPKTVLMNRIF